MVSKGVKKSSAAEVKSSKAGDDGKNIFDKDGHLIISNPNDVEKRAKEFLDKKEQLKTEKSNSNKESNKPSTEEEKQQKKREYCRKYYHNNKEKYKVWNKNWREKQKAKKQQDKSSPMKKETE